MKQQAAAQTSDGVADVYPLTYMQEGLLFHSLQDGAAGEYIVQVSCTLRGVDAQRWRSAWEMVTARVDALRTAFAWKSVSRPVQVVMHSAPLDWSAMDHRGLSIAQRTDMLRERVESDRALGFALSRAPLHRMSLLRWDEESFDFVWTYHHVVLDAWSAAIVMDWVMQCYCDGTLPQPAPFKTYVNWLRKIGAGDARRYWADKLDLTVEPAMLPLLAPMMPDAPRTPRKVSLRLPAASTAEIAAAARRSRFTLATLVQAAWALTLRDFCDAEAVTFGWVVADRPADIAGVGDMIGLMINIVPIQVRCANETTLFELMEAIQRDSTDAREQGRIPLTEIHELAGIDPGQSLFDTVVVFENIPGFQDGSDQGVVVENRQAYWRTTYPVSLMIAPGPEIKAEIAYNAEQIDEAAAEALLVRFAMHLADLGEDAGQRLGALREVGVADVPVATEPAPDALHLGEDIHARLLQRGATVALDPPSGEPVTWRELARRSDALATQLQALGFSEGDLIATHLDRDTSQIVALLALLRLGCPVLPIDPCLPADRKRFMLADSGAQLVLARAGDMVEQLDVPLAALSPDGGLERSALGRRLAPKLPPGTAYLLYTSGSTGGPKGVVVPEAALRNLLAAFADRPGLAASDRFLALTTVSFDIALLELLGPIWTGAVLVIAPPSIGRDGEALAEMIAASRPSVMQTTPVVWKMLVESGWTGSASLRAWCGGEALERPLADRLLPLVGSLWNLYGPTEATIWALVEKVEAGPDPIGLGRLLPGMRALVLDARDRPVPVGGRGELCLAGIGLATGYHNRPELTAGAFSKDPFGIGGASRIYRTGDIVHRMDGERLRYLGRRDEQIKLRGLRLELREVEQSLERHPAVGAAAARLWSGPDGSPELVGYVVCSQPVDVAEIRTVAASHLPPGAAPALILALPALPVSAAGKVDRRALPAPEWAGWTDVSPAHRSQIGEVVAAIWANVLGVAAVKPDDSFFALGGHSIKVLAVTTQINRRLGTTVSLAELFRSPRLADYIALLENAVNASTGSARAPILRLDRSAWHPLSPVQRRFWFVNRLDVDERAYQLACALRLTGHLDVEALRQAVFGLQHQHGALRTIFRANGGEPQQFILADPARALEVIDIGVCSLTEIVRQPLLLGDRPPVRFVLRRTAPEAAELILVIHHILVDEWSLSLLASDLGVLYRQFSAGQIPLPPVGGLDFIDFAAAEGAEAAGEGAQPDFAFWFRELVQASPTTLLYDYPQRDIASFTGATHSMALSAGLHAHVHRIARSRAVTPFVTLLTGLFVLLQRHTSAEDICIGVMDACRPVPEVERIVGPFSRALPIRWRMDHAMTCEEMMRALQSKLVDASVHARMPLDEIVRRLGLPSARGSNPLFNILVVMQNMPVRPKTFGDLAVEVMPIDTGIVEFDMLIEIFAVEDRLNFRFAYRAEGFSAARIADFASRLTRVLLQIVDDPTAPVGEINLLDEAEMLDLCAAFTATGDNR